MAELGELREVADPAEVLYVADALTGQTRAQRRGVPPPDRDHRDRADEARRRLPGGAALSAARSPAAGEVRGTGEKVDALEPFDPPGWSRASWGWRRARLIAMAR